MTTARDSSLAQATRWLQETLGPAAAFRDGQWEAIAALVETRQRTLVVQRTGWGKSMVYFMATRLLRARGAGPTILISPLLSLMRNQVASAAQWGVKAATVNSSNPDSHRQIAADLLAGQVDLLLISPERLANDQFRAAVWSQLRHQVGMLVVDEAHCISDWGHDFRPNYRRIMRLLDEIPPGTPVIGTTATANDRVVEDVAAILGAGMNIQRGPLTRDSLKLYAYPKPMDAAHRLILLSHLLKHLPGSGIIYCTTTRDCRLVAEWLQQEGFAAKAYYADVEEATDEGREALEDQLMRNEVKALVASVALGMGFDKSDLHFVIHYQLPGNIISYYQQIGRAGRGIDQAHIVLMHGPGDEDIQQYFIRTAFPTEKQMGFLLKALAQPRSLTDLEQVVNVRRNVLDRMLTHLEVEDVIEKRADGTYALLRREAPLNFERWAAVSQTRYAELDHMKAYLRERGCLMGYLARALDDLAPPERCGRCKNCTNAQSKFQPTPADIQRAQSFLREGDPIKVEPRRRWPLRSAEFPKTTNIRINELGIALCGYYDDGWGAQVRAGRAEGHYGDDLVQAAVKVIQAYWRLSRVRVYGVVPVPSLRRPTLVPDFAERLARALHVPFAAVIQHQQQHPPQMEVPGRFHKAVNVISPYSISAQLKGKPILLVDDFADSRWTLTALGDLLQRHGSGPVHPFVLAVTQTTD